jgi:serine/threonine-protein kinase
MATVYLAVASGMGGFNKLQVVKQLRGALAAEPEFLKMFLEEARLAARINHPNVVQTYEVGFDQKHHFIAMEYLEGPALESVVRLWARKNDAAQPPAGLDGFTVPMRLRILADVCAGLHYAHELTDFDGKPLHVVHRDISPHNVIVTYDGHVKLVDFGIAKAADSSDDTRTGVMKGKVAYMAAERFGRGNVDRRSDIFSVAAMMWHLLAREKLWKGLSDAEIFSRLATGQVPSPRTVDPNIDPRLEQICMKGLALRPEDRFQTAADMQYALEDYLQTQPRVTSRDIGQWVLSQFADRRAKIKAIVEEQMRATKAEGTALPMIGPTGAITRESVGGWGGDADLMGMGAREAALAQPAPQQPGVARLIRIASIGVVGLVAVAALVIALVRQRATEGSANAKTAKTATPFGNPATPLVTVNIHATPDNALLFIDDVQLPSNPSTSTMVRDGASHRIRAEAPGFATKRELVVFDSSTVSAEIVLEPEKEVAVKDPVKDPKNARPVAPTRHGAGAAHPPAGGATAQPTAEPTQAPPAATPHATAAGGGDLVDGKKPKKPGIDTKEDPWK